MKATASYGFKTAARMFSLLILCYLSRPVTSSSYVSVFGYSCSSDTGVEVGSFNVDCDQCAFGSKVGVTIDVYFSQDQTEQGYATVWLSKSYISFLTIFKDEQINICGDAESTGDAECPAAGSYQISTDFEVPDYNGYVTSFQAHLTMNDANGNMMLNCSATLNGGYQMMYTFAAAVCAAAFFGFFFQRKWKNGQVATASEVGGNFEMMNDPSVDIAQPNLSSRGVVV
mmetsp:Transcript_40308/g.49103  ORF Transcript_40308/g.49103 Transcript_40308/m.49103 type:complete len:228 (-) Transcript_40308:139-822(-)|eukprot:CAMPEP_0172506860 /NCGR_PEP_ID=MMETSP1066-20121228/199114_1 /TAXON_ID=671091 /ORGANISM="Coscinodiscus wailesii, Strain CCMP2513" /LENGTH=227 /DNA_ID=CAMNT_0013284117 /DNA_START=66 /DNA_END=749 /DNA_ORIENTATION=-